MDFGSPFQLPNHTYKCSTRQGIEYFDAQDLTIDRMKA
jgi:hypothetical protein